jgi:hypothetical protein
MTIKDLIHPENFSLTKLSHLLNNPKSEVKLTFSLLGSRILTVNGCSVNLHDVTQRVFSKGDKIIHGDGNSISLRDRCSGVMCVRKLREYYNTTDAMIKNLNWISSIFFKLKMNFKICEEAIAWNPTTAFLESARDKIGTYEHFRAYSEGDFRKTFPGTPLPNIALKGLVPLPGTTLSATERERTLYYYQGALMPSARDFCVF